MEKHPAARADKQNTQSRSRLKNLRENVLLLFDGIRFLSLLWQEATVKDRDS